MKKYTTQKEIRISFWEIEEGLSRRRELKIKRSRKSGNFRDEVRQLFIEYVDMLLRYRCINKKLASRVTLT